MADPRFIGLIQSVLSSGQAALGEEHSPMVRHLNEAGVRSLRTAQRSLALLEMLHDKTRGNLDPSEKTALDAALRTLQDGIASAEGAATALPMATGPGPGDLGG